MQIYTTTIMNTSAKVISSDRMDCKSFKTFDSAVEYLIDFLIDEGIIEMSGVPDAERFLRDHHAMHVYTADMELHIEENELCEW